MTSEDLASVEAPTQKRKRKLGRPAYAPTDRDRVQVRVMAGMLGMRQEEVALVLGITKPTLTKYFRRELSVAEHEANAQVAASLFRQATDPKKPNVVAAIFWLKVRAGWRDHDPSSSHVGGKKEQQQEDAAKVAAAGRFSPGSAPPALRVIKG